MAGASTGGHSAVLVAVSKGRKDLEGTIGGHAGQSTEIQALARFLLANQPNDHSSAIHSPWFGRTDFHIKAALVLRRKR